MDVLFPARDFGGDGRNRLTADGRRLTAAIGQARPSVVTRQPSVVSRQPSDWKNRLAVLRSARSSTTSSARSTGDVPGWEIPARYFGFARTGDAAGLAAVLEHNRLDLVSLAG